MIKNALPLAALGFVAAVLGTGCRKSEEQAAPVAETAQNVEAPAAQTKEIKLGQTMPYSGPASAYGTIGKLQVAFFAKLNRDGGVNGRTVKLLSLDDGYSPPKAVEQVRKLVEQEHVLAIFNAVGTASNSAIHKYLNGKEVPHLFVSSGASKWNDPQNFPWTIGLNPSYRLEGKTYAQHILKTNPNAKIAVLYQNDDFGKDVLAGLKEGLGPEHEKQIVAETSYEVTDATVDSQIVRLKGSKADVFVNLATPKFSAQAIRKVHDLKWKVAEYVANVGASIGTVLVPAGVEASKGVMTVGYFKDPADPRFDSDPAMQEFKAFLKAEYPDANVKDASNAYAFLAAQTAVQVLKQCGDDLSPKNLMAQAASLKDFAPGLLLDGIKMNTSPTDFEVIDQLRIVKFSGEVYDVID